MTLPSSRSRSLPRGLLLLVPAAIVAVALALFNYAAAVVWIACVLGGWAVAWWLTDARMLDLSGRMFRIDEAPARVWVEHGFEGGGRISLRLSGKDLLLVVVVALLVSAVWAALWISSTARVVSSQSGSRNDVVFRATGIQPKRVVIEMSPDSSPGRFTAQSFLFFDCDASGCDGSLPNPLAFRFEASSTSRGAFVREVRLQNPLGCGPFACPPTEVSLRDIPEHSFYRAYDAEAVEVRPYVETETVRWRVGEPGNLVAFAYVTAPFNEFRLLVDPFVGIANLRGWGLALATMIMMALAALLVAMVNGVMGEWARSLVGRRKRLDGEGRFPPIEIYSADPPATQRTDQGEPERPPESPVAPGLDVVPEGAGEPDHPGHPEGAGAAGEPPVEPRGRNPAGDP